MSLGHFISEIPRELQLEIISRVDRLSMAVIRYTLIGGAVAMPNRECEDVYKHGLRFMMWFRDELRFVPDAFMVGQFGDRDMITWALLNVSDCYEVCYGIACQGSLELLQYACNIGLRCDMSTRLFAAESGSIAILEWIAANPQYYDDHRNIVDYFATWRGYGDRDVLSELEIAAENGHLECMKYLRGLGYEWGECSHEYVIQGGSLECLKYARDTGCSFDSVSYEYAITHKSLEIVKWLYEIGCESVGGECYQAVASNAPDVLRWLYENGFVCNNRAFALALIMKEQECLKYLIECGFKYTVGVADYIDAVGFGCLENLKLLHLAGYRANFDVCKICVAHDQAGILEWAIGAGYELNSDAIIAALDEPDSACSEYLNKSGLVD